jgi:superfamily II DNA or RNA helicase
MAQDNKYVNLKNNGRLFPQWIMHNFKKYKLPDVMLDPNVDPCDASKKGTVKTKMELRKYQLMIGEYIGPTSPYSEVLLYHGLGSGKTATSINLLNVLYNHSPNVNFIILIKASLHDDPWMTDLNKFLQKDDDELKKSSQYKTIRFVHYDSPFADRDFINVMKAIDISKPTTYIVDEAHNFIRNVYSNINSKTGKRAQVIYDYIVREKKENKNTKIVLISATPVINVPFELALLFNLLRPNIFPSSETEFNRLFITDSNYPILNPTKKNMFIRRIMGLVSYYIGSTPDMYAKKDLKYVNLEMSQYQYSIYLMFQKTEDEIQRKAKRMGRQSKMYRTYTRQACNFVFPHINAEINGSLRPRPYKFNVDESIAENIEKGKNVDLDVNDIKKENLNKYINALNLFVTSTEKFFNKIHLEDVNDKHTIFDDLKFFNDNLEKYEEDFNVFYNSKVNKSKLFHEMYNSSPKMLAIAFMIYTCKGKALVYTNYVVMEGIDMIKVYLRLCGFDDYKNEGSENKGYCEYHGRMEFSERVAVKHMFNDKNNIRGEKCKIILISPSAAEGIQLLNILQEHIVEPYWTEVRIEQVIGRGIRACSHSDLPMNERIVKIYRYKVVKPQPLDSSDITKISTDQHVEDQAKAKSNLNESFLSVMREGAFDCSLFKSHNMMAKTYQCFNFPENVISGTHVGPAYKEDIKEDVKYDSGIYSNNAKVEKIKVIKITAVYVIDNGYSEPMKYWYYPKSGVVYDEEMHYPIGHVKSINGVPEKLNKDVYIMTDRIDIPTI